MNSSQTSSPKKTRPSVPSKLNYALVSSTLKYESPYLYYDGIDKTYRIDLSELIFPPTRGHPRPLRLSDEPAYVDLALAIADRRVIYSRPKIGIARAITRQLYFVRNVLDWLRAHGVYRLSDVSEQDLKVMLSELAQGGWHFALKIHDRWNNALDLISSEELREGFHYYKANGGIEHVDSLQAPFWRLRLGWGGVVPLPPQIKEKIAQRLNVPISNEWSARTQISTSTGKNVMRNYVTTINDWACLPDSVDRMRFRIPHNLASPLQQTNLSTRTPNLALDKAIEIIKAAFWMQYEIAPQVLRMLEVVREGEASGKKEFTAGWLVEQAPIISLNSHLKKPIARWVFSGHHGKQSDVFSFEQVIGAVQSACAIVLAMMNARRQREICDPNLGLRVGDLTIIDDELGIYLTKFYIEKSYFDRHEFHVNRTSADAIRTLHALKELSLPASETLIEGTSLFSCHRRTELGIRRDQHLIFSGDLKRARSLTSFFEVSLNAYTTKNEVTAHMFRRFYAILYMHRYDHAELRALRQHLRHIEVAQTRVYITDPSTRSLAESIKATMGQTRFNVADRNLHLTLESLQTDYDEMLDEVGYEKLRQTVKQIIDGAPTGGGFSRLVNKLFRHTLSRISFGTSVFPEPVDQISRSLSLSEFLCESGVMK